MPFDRLIAGVDAWADRSGRTDVFAQIGPTALRPRAIRWEAFITPSEFRTRVRECDALVAHAGMGSILTALEFGKPVLVMPRRASHLETRNDHQVATANRLKALGKLHVAMDEHELPRMLDRLGVLGAAGVIEPFASPSLLRAVRDFIHARPGTAQNIEPKVPEPIFAHAAPPTPASDIEIRPTSPGQAVPR